MKRSTAPATSTVSPCLMVESIQDELEFLKAVFGAEPSSQQNTGDRSVWQVCVRLGDCIVMIGRANKGSAPTGAVLYVWTADVRAAYARAIEAGAELISAPIDQPTGVCEAGFRDPQGQIWWVGQRMKKPSNRQVQMRLAEQRRKRL